ncbi:hypothetical protein GCK32_019841 [Trichostrongylus colubriformis]|uniref:ZIG1/7 N-terminal domain-containing protein n=1 Tax=Trichostrongylus colubriformis TaxID=6319 RepID=A0AAN8FJB5_TRICO
MLLLLRFLIGFYVYGIVGSSSQSTAIGNLAVVIRGNGALSTDEEPLSAATPDLWHDPGRAGLITEGCLDIAEE